ncbi:hypothetical protein IJ768_00095 [Candidatus Saccharibacteria bacterium]|nr:hypothetical protein [Candidatus Saccharibacteria bacterium]
MKKISKRVFVAVLALVAVLGISVTVYAAANTTTYSKVGNQYVVDYISNEKTVDGVVVQTIERKWIPENRFNPNDPRNPIGTNTPAPNNNTNGNKVQTLRNAGINSRNDLQTYGWSYQWSTTPVETYSNNDRVETQITFQVDESASADRWKCTFTQIVRFDNAGNPYVKYYIGNQEYSADSIKTMFRQYGKAR